jgi:hypothetical protein
MMVVLLRLFGGILVAVGLVGVVWPFYERYILQSSNSPVADAFIRKSTSLFTLWLENSAMYWQIAGIGAVICAITTLRPTSTVQTPKE